MIPLIFPGDDRVRQVAAALASASGGGGPMTPAQMAVADAMARKNTAAGDEPAYDAALGGGAMTPQQILEFKTNARRLGYSDDFGSGPGVSPTGVDDKMDAGSAPVDPNAIHAPGTGVRDLFRQQPTGSPLPGGQPVPYRKAGIDADPWAMLASQFGDAQQATLRNGGIQLASAPGAPKEAVATVGKPLTEAQSKDTVFVTRALGAAPLLDKYGKELTDWVPEMAGKAPFGWGSNMQSADYQRAEQAGQEFLSALLRKDTGATITPDEQAYYAKMYLPQPGNKPELLEQKRAARARAVMAMQMGLPVEAITALEKAGMNPVLPSATKPRDDLKSKYGLE